MPTDLGYNKQHNKRQLQKKTGFSYNATPLLFFIFMISLLTLYFDVPSRLITKPTATHTPANIMNLDIPDQPKDGKTWKEVNKEHYE